MEEKPTYLLCSARKIGDAEQCFCSKCGETVYVSRGNVMAAVEKKFKFVCIKCIGPVDRELMRGVMNHGQVYENPVVDMLLDAAVEMLNQKH